MAETTDLKIIFLHRVTKQALKALGIKPQALRAFLSLLKIYQKIVSVGAQKRFTAM
jgi:hypothetical protein